MIKIPEINLNPAIPFAGTVVKMTQELAMIDDKPGLLTQYYVKKVSTILLPGETYTIEDKFYKFSYTAEGELWTVVIMET
jgi:hypothetical protein